MKRREHLNKTNDEKITRKIKSGEQVSTSPILTSLVSSKNFPTPQNVMQLQRLIGNRATTNLLYRKPIDAVSSPSFSGMKMAIQRKPPENVEQALAISESASNTFPTSKPKQNKDVFSSLRIDAQEGFSELKSVSDGIASQTGGTAHHRNKLKGFDRSWDKIVKKYGSDASGLIDTIGSKIVYDDFKGLYGALDILVSSSPVEVVYFQDRFLTPVKSGYSDIIMSVRLSNGHIAELRLHLASVDEVFEKEHRLYEKIRKGEKLSPDEQVEYKQLKSEYKTAREEAFKSLG